MKPLNKLEYDTTRYYMLGYLCFDMGKQAMVDFQRIISQGVSVM